jgi:DNA polymerase III epsilon subunit-like protein
MVGLAVETTGLIRPNEPFPVPWQIAALRVEPDGQRHELDLILDWGVGAPPEATLRGASANPPHKTGWPPLRALIDLAAFVGRDSILVGHRIDVFDVVVLRTAYDKLGVPLPPQFDVPGASIDTRTLAVRLFGPDAHPFQHTSRPKNLELVDMARHFGIGFEPTMLHDAHADADLALRVLGPLLALAATTESPESLRFVGSRRRVMDPGVLPSNAYALLTEAERSVLTRSLSESARIRSLARARPVASLRPRRGI